MAFFSPQGVKLRQAAALGMSQAHLPLNAVAICSNKPYRPYDTTQIFVPVAAVILDVVVHSRNSFFLQLGLVLPGGRPPNILRSKLLDCGLILKMVRR